MERAGDYLMRYRDKLDIVKDCEAEVRMLEERLTGTTASYDGDGTAGSDPIDRKRQVQAQYCDAKRVYDDAVADAMRTRDELESVINQVHNSKQRRALLLYYCDAKSMSEVCKVLKYGRTQMYNIRNAGLRSVQKVLAKQKRGY